VRYHLLAERALERRAEPVNIARDLSCSKQPPPVMRRALLSLPSQQRHQRAMGELHPFGTRDKAFVNMGVGVNLGFLKLAGGEYTRNLREFEFDDGRRGISSAGAKGQVALSQGLTQDAADYAAHRRALSYLPVASSLRRTASTSSASI
jgi:hypothetical protein